MSRTLPNHPASKCHPPRLPSPASGGIGPVGAIVGDPDGDVGVPPDGVPVGPAELVVADAEGDVLFDGDGVGVEVRRALVVGLAGRVAVGAIGAVLRLAPGA